MNNFHNNIHVYERRFVMSQDKTEHALIYCYNMPYRSFTIYDHAYAFVYVYFYQTLVIAEADGHSPKHLLH